MSINKSELRIGNWVLFSPSGKKAKVSERPVKISQLLAMSLISQDSGLELELMYDGASVKPIPLSPEVLLACGFTYIKVEGVASLDEYNPIREENTHNWTLNIKREGIYDGRGRLELVKWGDSPKEKIWFSDQWLRVEMKHLHQLQNLYHSLTGKELVYSPNTVKK